MNRTAVVTGSNRGIGLAVALELAKAGHRIIIGSRDGGAGEKVAADLRAEGARMSCHIPWTCLQIPVWRLCWRRTRAWTS